jgi:hypothetical protein
MKRLMLLVMVFLVGCATTPVCKCECVCPPPWKPGEAILNPHWPSDLPRLTPEQEKQLKEQGYFIDMGR